MLISIANVGVWINKFGKYSVKYSIVSFSSQSISEFLICNKHCMFAERDRICNVS